MMQWTTPVVVVVCLLFSAAPALAQLESGEIVGRVTDTTGAVLPGATITLEGSGLIQPQTATAADSGSYRFPKLPLGVYRLTFHLEGFATLIREGIRVETGFVAEINAQLHLSSLAETITVSGESPVVDMATTKTGASFSRETLDALPSARDPWVILEQTAGMVMDRQNVGGNESGQQSSFLAHGSDLNQQWNVNGATVTDMASNASPGYYDFDSFEEIQISTGGGDASQEAGGVAINLVTKSGSNKLKAGAKFVYVNDALQSDNIDDELRAQNAGRGNPIKDIREYGFDVGGPIKRNKAWFWGALSANDITAAQVGFLKAGCTDQNDVSCLEEDTSNLDSANLKLDYQWATGHKSGFYWKRGTKFRNTRGAGPNNPFETTVIQRSLGPGDFQASHQWIVSDRLALDGKFTYSDSSFDLDFQEGVEDVQPTLDLVTSLEGRSTTANYYERPTYETRVDGNYFLPALWKGDHATKFGVRYRSTPYSQQTVTGGGVIARLRNGVPAEAELRRDGYTTRDLWEFSTYFHDTIRAGRWTWNLGVRWDYQDDEALAAQIPANTLMPDLLPALNFPGADSGVAFSNVSPRFGVSYDLTGSGRTVAKFNANRYYGLGIFTAGTISPTGQTTLRYRWNDLNGDLSVQRDELDLSRILNNSANYNPNDPASIFSPASVDPNFGNDITDEVIVAFDHELASNFAVGASYIWRRYHNDTWDTAAANIFRPGITSADFIERTLTVPCGNSSCDQPSYTVSYWELPFQRPAETLLRNWERVRKYQGIELTARKRFSNRWMMMGSFTWNDTRLDYNGADRGYQDPTDVAQYDGRQAGTLNVRWVAKLSGMYQLPWGFSTGAFLNTRQGFPFYREIRTPSRSGGLGTADVDVYPFTSERYPNLTLVDWRIDKRVALPGNTRLDLVATVFNVLNSNTVLDRFRRQESSTANNIEEVLAPRVINLQARFVF
jgi:hypothetical protein